jgi:hypothetical protein
MVIGVKSYRLQYHDELSQPQAEIDFEQLIAFLLDRGAVPDKGGFSDLRSSGLWTPAGTKLLLAPTTSDAVLMVATSDDSDGILSLSLQWKKEWDLRNSDSIPPYWTRIGPPPDNENILLALGGANRPKEEKEGFLEDDSDTGTPAASLHTSSPSPVRLRIGATGIDEAYAEGAPKTRLRLPHLRETNPNTEFCSAFFWFACAATALGAPKGGLWSFAIPADMLAVARRETMPCGVMVLLDVMSDEQVPTWRGSVHDDQAEQFERHVRMTEQSRRVAEEMRLPPEQQEIARQKRFREESMNFHNECRRRNLREQQKREQAVTEAMLSQKLGIQIVAEANRKWLVKKEYAKEEMSISDIVEQVLWGMIQDEAVAKRIAAMLDQWKSWTQSGGMTKSHYLLLKEDQVTFALASCVLYVMKSTAAEPTGSVVSDLQECLRIWKRVRLG